MEAGPHALSQHIREEAGLRGGFHGLVHGLRGLAGVVQRPLRRLSVRLRPPAEEDKGLTLEDLEASHRLMCSCGVRPSLQAFDLFLFGEKVQETDKPQIGASSKEIEAYASNSLAGISAILEASATTINTGGHATTES